MHFSMRMCAVQLICGKGQEGELRDELRLRFHVLICSSAHTLWIWGTFERWKRNGFIVNVRSRKVARGLSRANDESLLNETLCYDIFKPNLFKLASERRTRFTGFFLSRLDNKRWRFFTVSRDKSAIESAKRNQHSPYTSRERQSSEWKNCGGLNLCNDLSLQPLEK